MALETLPHPFSPLNIQVPGFIANSISAEILLVTFFGGIAAIVLSALHVLGHSSLKSLGNDKYAASWFILCGCIHLFFEGYFSYNSLSMGTRTDYFGQLWKEYALSDSRYMTRDSFVVCMESVTAFLWGPLSFFVAYCILKSHPARHPIQLIVSVGQLYGLVLYYGTCAYEELIHDKIFSRPERVYYWGYYIVCNAFWLFIPGWLIYQSVRDTIKAFDGVAAVNANTNSDANMNANGRTVPIDLRVQVLNGKSNKQIANVAAAGAGKTKN